MITYPAFKKIFDAHPGDPECEIYFKGTKTTYMIIKYDDYVTFQRCGVEDGSGEFVYRDLDTLYHSVLLDGICLEKNWDNNIETIVIDSAFDLAFEDEIKSLKDWYQLDI